MSQSVDKSHVEAWKSLIELSKTTISIASAILTALIGFFVLNQTSISTTKLNYIAPALLTMSILAAIYGFGRAIRAIKSGNSETNGIALTNISIFLMAVGILSISLISFDKKATLDNILSNIERETKSLKTKLTPNGVIRVEVVDSNYLVTYVTGNKTTKVTYSVSEKRIIELD